MIHFANSRANWPSWCFLLLVLANAVGIVLAENAYLLGALVFLQGILLMGVQEAKHQCMHGQFLKGSVLNDVVGTLAAALFGTNFVGNRQFHLHHHRHTCDTQDPEATLYAMSWKTRWICLLGATEQVWVAVHINRLSRGMVPKNLVWRWQCNNAVLAVFAVAFAAGLYAAPLTTACVYVIPFCLFSWMDFFFTQAEHYGVLVADAAVRRHPADISNDIVLPLGLSWLTLHRSLHRVHHAAPATRWFQAPRTFAMLPCGQGARASGFGAFVSRWFRNGPRLWLGQADSPPVLPWNRTLPRTRLFDSLSLLLPAGEAFLIATLGEWRQQAGHAITPGLQAELDRFIREEQAHQRAHDRYNAALIAQVPAAAALAQRAAAATQELASLDLPMRMALVAAFEYLTAVLSAEVCERSYLLVDDASVQVRMWRWHAREEMEHCHVALESAAQCGIGRVRRSLALVLATCYLGTDVLRYTWTLCRSDIAAGASRWTVLADACSFFLGGLPSLARMALGWGRYLVR